MPTARELLQQADALMRRQHEPAVATPSPPAPEPASGPPTQGPATDARFEVTQGPPTVAPTATGDEGGPARPAPTEGVAPFAPPPTGGVDDGRPPSAAAALSALRWSAPAPPTPASTSSPVFAPPPSRSPRTIQREPIAPSVARTSLPVDPTESPAFAASAAPAPVIEMPPEPDFPLLTDAVAPADLPGLAGDDEVPLLADAVDPIGDEPILEDFDEPSIWSPTLGAAPTIEHVPRAANGAADGARDHDPLGLNRPPPGFEAPHTAQWEPSREPAAAIGAPGPGDVEPTVAAAADVPSGALVEVAQDEAPPANDVEGQASQPFETLPVVVPGASAVLATPLDDARVREIAEEIGMQVLQRIDIFTDTELRARLGERLKPVVERVSAELVAAINQHVGELLRSYVAEAIEREIDRWNERQP